MSTTALVITDLIQTVGLLLLAGASVYNSRSIKKLSDAMRQRYGAKVVPLRERKL